MGGKNGPTRDFNLIEHSTHSIHKVSGKGEPPNTNTMDQHRVNRPSVRASNAYPLGGDEGIDAARTICFRLSCHTALAC